MSISSYLEDFDSQIPALQLLLGIGAADADASAPRWQFLSREQALCLRGGRSDRVILEDVLSEWMAGNNQIESQGQQLDFEKVHIAEAIRRLREVPLDGLVRTNEKIYHLLTLGTSIDVVVNDDRKGRQVNYINWKEPEKNVYHVSAEFSVERSSSHEHCRPDIVLFINGIPVVVIECKRRDQDSSSGDKAITKAAKQMLTYQKDDHIPQLFTYAQLLIGSSVNDITYATTGTELKYWAVWKEKYLQESDVEDAANHPFADDVLSAVFRAPAEKHDAAYATARTTFVDQQEQTGRRLATAQDRVLFAMLRPQRLLRFIRDAVLFDAGTRKVARYQQWFAVEETIKRIRDLHEGRREGGVIWQTTGSGKSITMVMLAKAIAFHPAIPSARVVLVTDREDLDEQLQGTFEACGKAVAQAKSGVHLAQLISDGKASIISTIINKFASAMNTAKIRDESPNIIVMVDESHRTNYGTFAAQMRRVFPNACYLAFTGTPLLKKEKQTARKFGGFIPCSYTMSEAVEDGAVTPLIYEGRVALLEQNQKAMDAWFERLTEDLNTDQKTDLKRKMARREIVEEAKNRLKLVAFDISQHYRKNFQGRGLKGQVAAHSRTHAILLRQCMQEFGMVRAEVIMSQPEARYDVEENENVIADFWSEMMTTYGNEVEYNKKIKASFSQEDGDVELLIVIGKLLTGFDEPRNTVLYIDKKIQGHNILQAIARVNRLFPGKDYGYIVDYKGILGGLNEAMDTYEELAGFDKDDLEDAFVDVNEVIADLPQHHTDLWSVFKEVRNQADNEAMERHLEAADRREYFYQMLRQFQKTFSVSLASERMYEVVPEDRISIYKKDFKRFTSMRRSVQSRYADTIDYSQYEKQIRKMMDSHIMAPLVEIVTPEMNIFDRASVDLALADKESTASKADTIASRMSKVCYEKMEEDPAFYTRFAEMIQQIIDAYRQQRLHESDYLEQIEHVREQLVQGQDEDIPKILEGPAHREARAFYGIISQSMNMGVAPADKRAADVSSVAYDSEHMCAQMSLHIEELIAPLKIRDWRQSPDVIKDIEDKIDDYLFDARDIYACTWDTEHIDAVLHRLVSIIMKQAE